MKRICPYCHYPNYEEATFCVSCQEGINHVEPTQYVSNQTLYNPIKNPIETSRYVGYIPEEITILNWVLILIGLAIPVVNFIVIGSVLIASDNETLKNFVKANIIVILISIITYFLLFLFKIVG